MGSWRQGTGQGAQGGLEVFGLGAREVVGLLGDSGSSGGGVRCSTECTCGTPRSGHLRSSWG